MINVNYKTLNFHKESLGLVQDIYKVTKRFPTEEKFGLVSQLRRASVSISSNIAEGSGRSTSRDFKCFLHTALGSSLEIETQLKISRNLKFLTQNDYSKLQAKLDIIIGGLHNYIKKMNVN